MQLPCMLKIRYTEKMLGDNKNKLQCMDNV